MMRMSWTSLVVDVVGGGDGEAIVAAALGGILTEFANFYGQQVSL